MIQKEVLEKIRKDIRERLPQLNPEIEYDIPEVKRVLTECADVILEDYFEQGYISSDYFSQVGYDRDREMMFIDIHYNPLETLGNALTNFNQNELDEKDHSTNML